MIIPSGEKAAHPEWIEPAGQSQQQSQYAPPSGPPQAYASRDGAPLGQYAPPPSYYPPPQLEYPSQAQAPAPNYVTYDSNEKIVLAPPPSASGSSGPSGLYGSSGPSGSSSAYAIYEPATPETGAGPSGSSEEAKKGGFMVSLASFFGTKGPPSMWQRQPPQGLPYNAFPPMCLISNGHDLTKGFPELPPPCPMNPHPFVTHDVTEEDWKRFLADVKKAASLSPAQRIKSNAIPLATGISFFGGFMLTRMIEKKMEYKNRTAAGDVVDHWNHYFFVPRRMELVLSQASERLSGRFGAAPTGDPNQLRMANELHHRTGDDDSDDDDDDDDYSSEDEQPAHGHCQNQGGFMFDRRARRAARREARHERREAKHERRGERRARKAEKRARRSRGENKVVYELFITAL